MLGKRFEDLSEEQVIEMLERFLKNKEDNKIFIDFCHAKYKIGVDDLNIFVNTYHNINDNLSVDLSNSVLEKITRAAIELPDSIAVKVLKNIGRHYQDKLTTYRNADGKTLMDLFIESGKYKVAYFLDETYKISCNA